MSTPDPTRWRPETSPAEFQEIEPDLLAAIVEHGLHPVQAFRFWRGLSLRKLAERSGVAADTIARNEAGRGELSTDELEAVAAALNVPARLLLE